MDNYAIHIVDVFWKTKTVLNLMLFVLVNSM